MKNYINNLLERNSITKEHAELLISNFGSLPTPTSIHSEKIEWISERRMILASVDKLITTIMISTLTSPIGIWKINVKTDEAQEFIEMLIKI